MHFSCFRPGSRLGFLGLALCILIVFRAGIASGAPAVWTWSTTDPLTTARSNHTATLLRHGQVLVVGGWADGTTLASAEL